MDGFGSQSFAGSSPKTRRRVYDFFNLIAVQLDDGELL